MGKVRVNTDAFVYTVPNPQSGQPDLGRAAHKGEVIELDAEQERRGRDTLVTKHYTVGSTTVPAREPALVDESYDENGALVDAAKSARRAQLQAEIDALGGTDVPTTDAPPVSGDTADDGGTLAPSAPPAPPAPPKRR